MNNDLAPAANSKLWNDSVTLYDSDVNNRLDEILSYVPSSVDVGLRTALTGKEGGGEMLAAFNYKTRNIAESRRMTMYDLDLDIYSTAHFNYSDEKYTHRDWIHHHFMYSYPATQKMLGRRYSKYMIFKNTQIYSDRFHNFLKSPRNETEVLYIKTKGSHSIYFLDLDNVRHEIESPIHFFYSMHASLHGDVLTISDDTMSGITLSSDKMSNSFKEGCIFNVEYQGKAYLYVKSGLRLLPNAATTAQMTKAGGRRVHHIDKQRVLLLEAIPIGKDLPNIFLDGSVLRYYLSHTWLPHQSPVFRSNRRFDNWRIPSLQM